MIIRKKWLLLIILVVIAISIISVCIYLVNTTPFDSDIKDSNRIEIRDGTNGNSYLLEGDDAAELSNKLLSLNIKMIGIDLWSSGYRYKVKIATKNNSEEIVIKTENIFVKGIYKYEIDENIIYLIENEIKK